MNYKIIPLTVMALIIAVTASRAWAISMGSVSDAISHSTSPTTDHVQTKVSTPTLKTNKSLPNPALFVEDAAMTAYIHSELLFKKDIPSVDITTNNAVVTISGLVNTKEQVAQLVKIASAVQGVKGVNTDHLMIREN